MGYVHYWGHLDYAAALAEFATARASLPDANVIAAIAYVHRRQGNVLKAVSEFEQATALNPRDTKLPGDVCSTLMGLRHYAEAVSACDRALALAPDGIDAQVYRATALRMRGDLKGAGRSLATIPANYDPQGSASLARFDLAMTTRQPDAALAAIAKAPTWLLDNKSNVLIPAMLLRGQALARKGESGPAHAAFLAAQRLLEALPREQPGAQTNLAEVYAGLGQTDAALAAARRATDLLPLSRDMVGGVFYLTQLAKIEALVGETDSALNHIEQLLDAPAGREVSAAFLRTDPAWDPLRKDPRFQKLIAEAEAAQAKIEL
jgi:tetratricopeptide (TPR) repeat protein